MNSPCVLTVMHAIQGPQRPYPGTDVFTDDETEAQRGQEAEYQRQESGYKRHAGINGEARSRIGAFRLQTWELRRIPS